MKNIKSFEEDIFESVDDMDENIIYKRYYPKENQDDNDYIKSNRQMLWKFLDDGYRYANLKEFRGCINARSLWKNAVCVKIASYNNVIVAVSVYTDYQGGSKCVGITATTDEKYRSKGKEAVIHIVKEDISLVGNFYWTVCSDALEHMYENYEGIKIPYDYIGLFMNTDTTQVDDYHFTTSITFSDGEIEDVKKVIYGFNSRDTFEYIKSQNDDRIQKCIDKIDIKKVKESIYIRNISNENYNKDIIYVFYEDRMNGHKDYSQKTLNILQSAIDYLKSYVEKTDDKKYMTAIETGEELLSTSTVMKIHSNIQL